MNKQLKILDVPFTNLNEDEVFNHLKKKLNTVNSEQLFIATPNPEMLLEAENNSHFKNVLQSTSLNLPDGNGLIWANKFHNLTKNNKSKLLITLKGLISLPLFIFHQKNSKLPFNKAIHGSDLMNRICLDTELSKKRIFLVGNSSGLKSNTSELVKQSLKKLNPNVNIVGNLDSIPTEKIIEKIRLEKPEILFVAFGAPKQEIWLSENLSKLPEVKIAIGVGGTFDFIAGIIPRAPIYMRKIGLEWLYRLYRQPKRIGRIINATIAFPIKIILNRLANHQ